ncbi:MAG: PspC domain-containing protein [Bacilli bacterium]|jgi:phage shock protein PspC (stress-responsive transcriptional regulator)|nr:PspC domain-containing protein [Bacilli bacterium]
MNNKLYRTDYNKMCFGVCNGLAEYFNIDVSLVRIIFAVGFLVGFGSSLIIYIVMAIILPTKMY